VALDEQLGPERLVTELSERFINLPIGEIDDASRVALGRICAEFGFDRSSLYTLGPNGFAVVATWTAADAPVAEPPPPEPAPVIFAEQVQDGRVVAVSAIDEVPDPSARHRLGALGIRSALVAPLSVAGRVAGAVDFLALRSERSWPAPTIGALTTIAGVFERVLARRSREVGLWLAVGEAERRKDELQFENVHLRREVRDGRGSSHIVARSAAMRRVLDELHRVAATDSTILLVGETGTGKELLATEVHELSARRERPMVRVNCAAIPSTLIESELFGREKGAFTGALTRQIGRFELAERSTIFLDEIGDVPVDVQVKLLRVLEERRFERLGSPRPIAADVRVIAATHRNLEQRIAEGTFRQDLFYRLNVFPVHVPPLRERAEDVPLLVWRFVEEFSKSFGKRVDAIDRDNLEALQRYAWPGNIRELRNVVERAMIGATGRRLSIAVPPSAPAAGRRTSARLIDVEREHIRAVLELTRWRVRGAGGAADRLGLKPTTLETRMVKLGLKRPVPRS
jgi:transcriptional regulator with GAF, ATPase, and Fis domain